MVVDASAWVGVATGRLEPADLGSTPLLVPAHFDAEVLSALRGLVRGRHFEPDEGEAWWQATLAAPLERVPLADLPDLWTLTTAVGAYDAPYVAVAVRARAPLLTTDARLARGAEPHCDVLLRGR
jgi:predicted nucleic acid-binding protein